MLCLCSDFYNIHRINMMEGVCFVCCQGDSPCCWVYRVSHCSLAAVNARLYSVLYLPVSFMPYGIEFYMYLQERAGADVVVYMLVGRRVSERRSVVDHNCKLELSV